MGNQTTLTVFYLSGLSDLPSLQLPLFLFFLHVYLLTLTWNMLIVVLIVTDFRLHIPMYFFLGNLACLDLFSSSVTVPRMLFDLYTRRRMITTTACMTQVFFFIFFAMSEVFLLTIMSYDRYIAICFPLRYMQIMHWKVCIQMASGVWSLGLSYSLAHTLCALRLTYCGSNTIQSFFCDLPHLFQLSCTDTFINILLVFFLGGILGIGSLILTLLPYIIIFKIVLTMKLKSKKSKVFSTCTSHLAVVFMFYGTVTFNYFRPSPSYHFAGDKLVSTFYTVFIPLLNPLIYSLRNQDIKTAFREVLIKIVSKIKKNSTNMPS